MAAGLLRQCPLTAPASLTRRTSCCARAAAGNPLIVCDTASLVAAALFRDPDHRRCVDLFAGLRMANRDMLLPASIIAEVGYLLAAKAGPHIEAASCAR